MKKMNIWVAVGVLQLLYGLILLVAGIVQFRQAPPTVLANLHATFWAGVVLTLAGLFFVVVNRLTRSGHGREGQWRD